MAHNEDNGPMNINNTFLVEANVNDEIPFFSYGYAGEVLTQSSAWNDYIIFTSDFVHPANPVQGIIIFIICSILILFFRTYVVCVFIICI